MTYRELIYSLLFHIKNPVIFELGSYDGNDTEWFRSHLNNPIIHCFEPDPRNIELFEKRGLDKKDNLYFNRKAVGNKTGKVRFYLSSGKPASLKPFIDVYNFNEFNYVHTSASSLKRPCETMGFIFPWLQYKKEIQVESITLDKYCVENNINYIDFIWADIQGAEGEMIEGAKEILQNTRYLFTEYSDMKLYWKQLNLKQILELLPEWEIVKDFGSDVLLRNMKYND